MQKRRPQKAAKVPTLLGRLGKSAEVRQSVGPISITRRGAKDSFATPFLGNFRIVEGCYTKRERKQPTIVIISPQPEPFGLFPLLQHSATFNPAIFSAVIILILQGNLLSFYVGVLHEQAVRGCVPTSQPRCNELRCEGQIAKADFLHTEPDWPSNLGGRSMTVTILTCYPGSDLSPSILFNYKILVCDNTVTRSCQRAFDLRHRGSCV